MKSDWISVCCSAEPYHMFSTSGDESIGITGLCSGCGEHTEFKESDDEEES